MIRPICELFKKFQNYHRFLLHGGYNSNRRETCVIYSQYYTSGALIISGVVVIWRVKILLVTRKIAEQKILWLCKLCKLHFKGECRMWFLSVISTRWRFKVTKEMNSLSMKGERIERSIKKLSKKLEKIQSCVEDILKTLNFVLLVLVVVVIVKVIIVWKQEVICKILMWFSYCLFNFLWKEFGMLFLVYWFTECSMFKFTLFLCISLLWSLVGCFLQAL